MRLPDLTPAELSDEQRALREQILGGPRGSGPQHFQLVHDDGSLTGPFGIMLHEPALGAPLQELGAALRYATGLTDRVRELAILAVAAATGSAFEAYAHERVGRAVGLTDDELAALADGSFSSADPQEVAAHDLCRHLLEDGQLAAGADVDVLTTRLGPRATTELVVLVGYYRTLAQLLDVFEVGAPTAGQ
ncbi:carboxymuconolactone decarboxylase family protein [Nocardioides cavernae]|uniref:Carboxymuconolactone decarboxylase family protein n=1 Tax=Nocardioides cavernae TaxID=1921566 RepID=A0ABR8N8S3_9ACTN|nr:carboxymuconolactone decarboxylase family protein [Nocardioides cavernae]MBD3924548.1 carboxymuconolactone decarboxylase family protein [Nocardioides cavernae]MBM7510503.1 4-carboxymuconolactone decarboxylase [Nocardioides cavernae]